MARPQPMRPALVLALALAATSTASTRTQTPPTGILIKGGTVIDGTGAPRRSADVRISGDTIVEVGPNLTAKPGDAVIDAAGRVVTPGFIDMHSHADRGLEDHPDAASQIQQGITLSLVGPGRRRRFAGLRLLRALLARSPGHQRHDQRRPRRGPRRRPGRRLQARRDAGRDRDDEGARRARDEGRRGRALERTRIRPRLLQHRSTSWRRSPR